MMKEKENFENLCKMIWGAPPGPHIVGTCVMLHPKPHRVFIVEQPRLVGTPCPTAIELPEGCITMEAYFNSLKEEEDRQLPTQHKAGPDPELCYPAVTPPTAPSRNNK